MKQLHPISDANSILNWDNQWKKLKLPKKYIIKYPKVEKYINKKNAKIIDIGGGTGWFCSFLKNLGYDNITNLDFSNEAIQQSKNNGINSIQFDIVKNSFPEKYEIVVCQEFLEHMENPQSMFVKVGQISTNLFIVTIPYHDGPQGPSHYYSIGADDLLEWGRLTGFKHQSIHLHQNSYLIGVFQWK